MISVLTNGMVRFEIDGGTWEATRYINGADGVTQLVTKVLKGGVVIAEFADIHAIWDDGKGELIKPDAEDR